MTREEAISHLQKMIGGWQCDVITAINMAIEALEQPEQNPLIDKVGEETDDTDKLKFVAHKLDKLDEKIQQLEKDVNRLEKDVNRLEKSRTIEVKPMYPTNGKEITTNLTAYAGPEFRGVCTGIPTNAP